MKELQTKCYPRSGTMPIGELAEKTKVKVVTIRYYESLGLLPDPRYYNNGKNRSYSDPYVDRLIFIKKARALGFSLREIKEILRLADRRRKIAKKNLAEKVYNKMGEIEEQISSLRTLKKELYKLITVNYARSSKKNSE